MSFMVPNLIVTSVTVMVDFGGSAPKLSIEELLMKRLRPGDILTHTYSSIPTRESLVDDNLKVKPFVFVDVRGVKMKGTQKLEMELTVRNGRIVYDLNGISAAIWDGKPQ